MSEISKQTQEQIDSGEYLKMWSGNLPKFCRTCGSLMIKERWFSHFDVLSGKEKYGTTLKCSGFFSWFHEEIKFNSRGNEIIERY